MRYFFDLTFAVAYPKRNQYNSFNVTTREFEMTRFVDVQRFSLIKLRARAQVHQSRRRHTHQYQQHLIQHISEVIDQLNQKYHIDLVQELVELQQEIS